MTSIIFNLIYLIVAVATVFLALRVRDKLTGVKFRDDILSKIKENPIALSIFYGAWVFGVCHLAGRMLGLG